MKEKIEMLVNPMGYLCNHQNEALRLSDGNKLFCKNTCMIIGDFTPDDGYVIKTCWNPNVTKDCPFTTEEWDMIQHAAICMQYISAGYEAHNNVSPVRIGEITVFA